MKARRFITLITLLFYIISCANKNPATIENDNNKKDTAVITNQAARDSFEVGKVIGHVACKNDATQSYALYIPAKGSNEALPVIYFFDPHGDGSFPLKKYKNLSNAYDFILIGSNNSKNGNDWSTTENIWRNLFDDTQKRLKINSNRIYTCGFSGGAKVASYVALHNQNVKGVIANGAALPDETPANNFSFSFTAIAGEGDMNMTDLVAISNELDKTQTRHRIIFFDGKHEWAPENTMNTAFAGLQLDAMHEKIIPKDDRFINNYIFQSKKRLGEYYNINNLIKAEKEVMLSINMLNGLTNEVDWFKEKDASIKSNVSFQRQWQAQQNLFSTEQNMKAVYMQQFQNGDINYWTKTIRDLQTRAKAQTDEGAMFERLLAYLSLAFYSISNQLITNNQNDEAKYFVGLYKMVDSGNSEAWYFSAILSARNNNAKATENDLMQAIENGFEDKNRMEQQPEFQRMVTQINFSKIESEMKKEK
jgi:predicted esterase